VGAAADVREVHRGAVISDPLLVYGANGYTGKLVVAEALARGLRPIVSGRNPDSLRSVAAPAGLEIRVADLVDGGGLDVALRGVKVALNCAGPFGATTQPLLDACLRMGAHYLDISGEVSGFLVSSRRDREARQRQIMVMPGAGFDVVPSDCLAAHVVRRLPTTSQLFLGISGLSLLSRGSARTMASTLFDGIWLRRGGELVAVRPATVERDFDYGAGPTASVAVSWADVVSAFFSTGVPDITVHFEATAPVRIHDVLLATLGPVARFTPWQALVGAAAAALPGGPEEHERRSRQAVVVAEARGADGRVVRSRLRTPEAYTLTAITAVALVRRVLDGDFQVGFQTPSRVYGPDFILRFPGVSREDFS
jgi:short subunit dehydrogenase-like uncharacterized protein